MDETDPVRELGRVAQQIADSVIRHLDEAPGTIALHREYLELELELRKRDRLEGTHR